MLCRHVFVLVVHAAGGSPVDTDMRALQESVPPGGLPASNPPKLVLSDNFPALCQQIVCYSGLILCHSVLVVVWLYIRRVLVLIS